MIAIPVTTRGRIIALLCQHHPHALSALQIRVLLDDAAPTTVHALLGRLVSDGVLYSRQETPNERDRRCAHSDSKLVTGARRHRLIVYQLVEERP